MAKIGLNNFRYAVATIGPNGAITYGAVKKPAKAVSFSFEPTTSDAKLYADGDFFVGNFKSTRYVMDVGRSATSEIK